MEETPTIPFKNLHSREYQGHKKKVLFPSSSIPSPSLNRSISYSSLVELFVTLSSAQYENENIFFVGFDDIGEDEML